MQHKFKSLKFWEFSGCKNFVLATDKHFSLKMKIFKSLIIFFETKCFVASFLPEYDKISFGKLLRPYPIQIQKFQILSIFTLEKCIQATDKHFSPKMKIFKS